MSILSKTEKEMKKVVDHLKSLFKGVSAGKADPELLNTIKVDCYGSKTAINQVSVISVVDFQTLQVQPFDPQIIHSLARAFSQSTLNFKVEKTKTSLLLKFPQVSGDTRKKLIKHAEQLAEQQRISLRKVRQNIKKELKAETLSKDEKKGVGKKIDTLTKKYSSEIDALLATKSKELLTK